MPFLLHQLAHYIIRKPSVLSSMYRSLERCHYKTARFRRPYPRRKCDNVFDEDEPRSGIHTVPDEVLQEIFEWVVGDDPRNNGTLVNASDMPAQMALASVCYRWHVVMSSLPMIWNHIIVDCAKFMHSGVPDSRFRLFMKMSRELPITLALTSVDRQNLSLTLPMEALHGELLEVMVVEKRRWKDVHLVLDHRLAEHLLTYMDGKVFTAQNLVSMHIDFRTRFWFDQDPHYIPRELFTTFLRLPSIRRFIFRTCSPFSHIPQEGDKEHWAKLKHFSLHVSYGIPHLIGLKMMEYLTHAEYIRLNLCIHRKNADGVTREVLSAQKRLHRSIPQTLSLPHLKELILSVDHEIDEIPHRVFGMVDAPNLEALAVSLDPSANWDANLLLQEAARLVCEAPTLKTLYVRFWNSSYFTIEAVAGYVWMCCDKGVTSVEIAADQMLMVPTLRRWASQNSSIASVTVFRGTQGMSKFDDLK